MITLPWLIPTIFAAIILLGIAIGYWNGWKTATYFFVWNIIGLIGSIIVFVYTYEKIISATPGVSIGKINIKELIEINKNNIKPLFGLVYSLLVLVGVNIIAFILYWVIFPIRRALKREIKENKKSGISNKGIRFIGAGVGVITAFPTAALATGVASVLEKTPSSFTKINSKLVNGLSAGEYSNYEESVSDIRSFIEVAKDDKLINAIGEIFGNGGSNSLNSLTPSQKETLEKALNSNITASTISDPKLIESFIDKTTQSAINFTNTPTAIDASKIPAVKPETQKVILDSIIKNILPNTQSGNPSATKKNVKTYLNTLLGWSLQ